MKKVIFALCIFFSAEALMAQQLPIFSLYRDNSFVLNPAIAGSEDHAIGSITYREQWTQVEGNPRTMSANYRSPIPRYSMGLGGQIIYDKTGPTSFMGINISYNYQISFAKINPFRWPEFIRRSRLSFGISGAVYQYRLNASDIQMEQSNDQALMNSNQSAFMPNFGVGLYYYFDEFYLGYSVPQLVPFNISFSDPMGESIMQRELHHYIVMGGSIPLVESKAHHKFFIEPMVWFKYVNGAPFQIDGHLRFNYKKIFWVGAAYRSSKTMVAEIGFMIKERVQIGYAFDQAINETRIQMGNAHEILISYHLKPKKRWGRKNIGF
ncbi:MAG: type IX secretion system membrane protein PorP/SprF [Chitinophagales bacterium]